MKTLDASLSRKGEGLAFHKAGYSPVGGQGAEAGASVYERSDLTGERLVFWRRAVWRAHHHAATDSVAAAFAEALLAYAGYADDVSIAGAWGRWKTSGAISFPKGFPD